MIRVAEMSIVAVSRGGAVRALVTRNPEDEREWTEFMREAVSAASRFPFDVFVATEQFEGEWSVGPADAEGVGPFRFVDAPDAETAVFRSHVADEYEPF